MRSEVSIRPTAVAGMFYPASARALTRELEALLAATPPVEANSAVPKALIVPHAGYVYSGSVAASAYAALAPASKCIRRVVLLGPAHRIALRGLALPQATAFATPLGTVFLDPELTAAALALPQVTQSDLAHQQEHSLEVQLPFLQTVLDEFTLLPIVVGEATTQDVAELLDRVWGGPETLIVISSDLSHYHAYSDAQRLDSATARIILTLSPLADFRQACGATPVNGLLSCARKRALVPRLIALRNSGDAAGDKARVVGYGAFAFNENPDHAR